MATDQEKLDATETAITKALNAQEYQLPDGTRVRRPSVAELDNHLDRLKETAGVTARGGLFTRVAFGGAS